MTHLTVHSRHLLLSRSPRYGLLTVALMLLVVSCAPSSDVTPTKASTSALTPDKIKAQLEIAQKSLPALEGEAPQGKEAPKVLPEHMGISIRLGALNDLLTRALLSGMRAKVGADKRSIKVGPVTIPLALNHKLLAIKITADASCPTCMKVEGELAGKYSFGKVLNKKDGYRSRFSMIAPLVFAPSSGGGATLSFDLSQVVKFGGFVVESKLEKAPKKYRAKIASALDKVLNEQISKHIKPIKLVSFKAPSFGVDGLRVLPAGVSIDAQSKTVVLALYTNISKLPSRLDVLRVLGPDHAMAVGIHAQVLSHALRLSIGQSKIPGQYTADGKPGGPFHVVPVNTTLSASPDGSLTGLRMTFGLYRFDSAEAAVKSTGALVFVPKLQPDGSMKMSCQEIQFSDHQSVGALPDAKAWQNAQFVTAVQGWLQTALGAPSLKVPLVPARFGVKQVVIKTPGVASLLGLTFDAQPVAPTK